MAANSGPATKRRKKRRREEQDTVRMLEELHNRSDDELAESDIALTNLKCAMGLPHSENLEIARCLDRLDRMARHVRRETRRNLYRYHRDPGNWNHCEADWAAGMMITVLQQDFGIRYNPERIYDPDFRDSRDLFIHGLLFGNGGTCSSMPVLYVAIGRRLGYPLKLVHAKGHVFVRWDDAEAKHWRQPARFNIEATNRGLSVLPDEYYHTFPQKLKDWELAEGRYLYSLSPREELASFLSMRGHCLQDTKRFSEAARVYLWAAQLNPRDPHYLGFHGTALALSGVRVPPKFDHFAREAERERARINALDDP